MSLFHRALGLGRTATDAPLDVHAPLPPATVAETDSVRTISIRLQSMPPARARYRGGLRLPARPGGAGDGRA